ncbi:MAG: hypothetical protein DWP95_05535 [Proteobacteria bacterium]|nr:MAG: hypothetical protein DWP95_05535 [Pseudomonadota bacterium]
MRNIKISLSLLLLMVVSQAWSAIYWVGNSASCSGSNVRASLSLALLSAALNSDSSDEIRLTNTVTYTGNSQGSYELTDWSPSAAGRLTLVGGYVDCGTTVTTRTFVGDTTDTVFTVNTSAQASSEVTFKNLNFGLSGAYGLIVEGGGEVILDNVWVDNNDFGVYVKDGGYLNLKANSRVQYNGSIASVPAGGGIRCSGTNSEVTLSGLIRRNRATSGGNLYISSGCFMELTNGAVIEGYGSSTKDANYGGGIYVSAGGELYASGGQQHVTISKSNADYGGAMYLSESGRATLINAHIEYNNANVAGAAIYANSSSTLSSPQLVMDKDSSCGLINTCSAISHNTHKSSLIYNRNSFVDISRTMIRYNLLSATDVSGTQKVIFYVNSLSGAVAKLRLDRVAVARNEITLMTVANGPSQVDITHLTMARNSYFDTGSGLLLDPLLFGNQGADIELQNSIINDSAGSHNVSGIITGDCNLVDDNWGLPAGSYDIGTAQFSNVSGNNADVRQIASSPGVDMCHEDDFAWSNNLDIELQAAPVNENTNPQGMPGQTGGLFDAGYDEVYDNIGPDEFLLSVQKQGSGAGSIVSTPLGIACGTDCSEVYYKGTLVTLFANGSTGSIFSHWLNCPSASGNQCLVNVQASQTITAVFEPDDLIFRNGFE